jgi:hypothetical protein
VALDVENSRIANATAGPEQHGFPIIEKLAKHLHWSLEKYDQPTIRHGIVWMIISGKFIEQLYDPFCVGGIFWPQH